MNAAPSLQNHSTARSRRVARRVSRPAFDKAAVAALTIAEIDAMTEQELIAAIRAAELPTLDEESMAHVDFLPIHQLRRVARHCCRNQGY